MRRTCRICQTDVGSADFDLCGRQACQRAAVAREPGSDDDRQPTKCRHCTRVGQGSVCDSCRELIAGLELTDEVSNGFPVPAVNGQAETETEDARRERFHQARVANVNASFERGRRCLLARSLAGFPGGLERPQPR